MRARAEETAKPRKGLRRVKPSSGSQIRLYLKNWYNNHNQGYCDGSVAYLEGCVVRNGGFSVVGLVDCGGLGASDVDFYEKVTELTANKALKVTTA